MSLNYTVFASTEEEDTVLESGANLISSAPTFASKRGIEINDWDPKGQDKTVEILIVALIVIATIVSAMLVCFIIRRRLIFKMYPTIPDNFADLDAEEKKATLDLVLKRHADSTRVLMTTIRTNSSSESAESMEYYYDEHNRRRLKKNVWHSTHDVMDIQKVDDFDEKMKEEHTLRRGFSAPNLCSTSFTEQRREGILLSDQNVDYIGDFNSGELDKDQEYFLPISGDDGSDESVSLEDFFGTLLFCSNAC